MNPLLEHFDRISEAPNAVPRLRQFILDLAVRGKLVGQNPQDEPACELLRRIDAERARLAKTGEAKKGKAYPAISEDEAPFDVPSTWEWVRVRQVTGDRGQTVPNDEFTYIDVTAINKEVGTVCGAKVVSATDAPSRARKVVRAGDVLYSCVRPYLLNIAVVDAEIAPAPIASTAFAVLNGFGLVLPKYLWTVLRSPFMVECVEGKMRGQAYPAINDADFALLPIPLPPHAEQQRIVAKIDELMALCDRLDGAQVERERRRNRVVAAGLGRGEQPTDEGRAVHVEARFHILNLSRLTTRPNGITSLRQAILDLAIRGQLIHQDPNDESARDLIGRSFAERARLEKGGSAHRVQPRREIPSEMRPFQAPPGWEWATVQDLLLDSLQNGYSKKPDDAVNGVPILRISAGTKRRDGVVAEEEHKLIGGVSAELRAQYGLQPGDLLACRFNGNRNFVGRLSLYTGYLDLDPIYPDKLIRLRLLSQYFLPRLVRYFAESSVIRKAIENYCATTVGNWGISGSNLKRVVLPIPPLAEQQRIATKLDDLMSLCDQLEMQLAIVDSEKRSLLDAVLDEALAFESPRAGGLNRSPLRY